MDDPRLIFLANVILKLSRIINLSEIILLCGGPIKDLADPPESARDFIYRYLGNGTKSDLVDRIITPEEIQDWLHFGIYKDLISFERDLANIATWVVLFVESPGSICELGAFCFADEIKSKLILFIREDLLTDTSFIKYGPLNHLEALGLEKHINIYPWTVDKKNGWINEDSFKDISKDIIQDLQGLITSVPSTSSIKIYGNKDVDRGQTMILVTDLIDICTCLKLKEINNYLELLNIKIDKLKEYLFILEKVGLIKKISYGGERYYLIQKPNEYIKYSLNGGKSYDRMRLKVEIHQYYEKEDPRRMSAIRHHDKA